jgi:hypothetical protein
MSISLCKDSRKLEKFGIGRRFPLWKSVEKMAETFSGLLDDLYSLFIHPAFFLMPY